MYIDLGAWISSAVHFLREWAKRLPNKNYEWRIGMKKKKGKRVLAAIMAVLMVIGSMPGMPAGIFSVVAKGADASARLELDGAPVTLDFNDSTLGLYKECTSADGKWTTDDGVITFNGFYEPNNGHGLHTKMEGDTFSINVPAGKTTITMYACQYNPAGAVVKLYDGDKLISDNTSFKPDACGNVSVSYTSAVDTTLKVELPRNAYMHNLSVKAESAGTKLELDGAPVTVDFKDSALGLYTACNSATGQWKTDDGAITFNGYYAYNAGGHGLHTKQEGDTFSVNVPAGKTTITMYACQYNQAGAVVKLYDGDTLVSDDTNFKPDKCGEVTLEYKSNVDTTLKVELPKNAYMHSLSAKTESAPVSLILDGAAASLNLADQSLGIYTDCTTDASEWKSTDKIFTFKGNYGWGNGHGVHTKSKDYGNKVSINVPAGKTTISLGTCQYGTGGPIKLYDGDTLVSDNIEFKTAGCDSVDVIYIASKDTTLTVEFPYNSYLHSISAKAETVKALATVTGKVGAAVNGEKLVFNQNGSKVAEAVVTDGSYSVTLEVGKSYTIAFENSNIYEVLSGGEVDLTNAKENDVITNDITYSKWDVAKIFTLKIGDTVFKVTPGSEKGKDFTVEKVSGSGSVEVVTAGEALVWTDLGGAGNGTISASKLTDLSDNIEADFDGNTVTVKYKDASSAPRSYKITAKDNSASGIPKANGTVLSYNFGAGDIVSKLHDKPTPEHYISGGQEVTSTDKLITLVGNNGIMHNDTTHGIAYGSGDVFKIKVAGNASISMAVCKYAAKDGILTVTGIPEGGKITPESASNQSETDGEIKEFRYTGPATELIFTYTGSGAAYMHNLTVVNDAEQTTVTPQAVMPDKLTNIGTADTLTVTPNGQRLVFTQKGGSMGSKDGKVDSSVSYYGFPVTGDISKLELDVVLNSCGNSNSNGVFVGAFNEDGIATVAIRKGTGLRGIYSKSSADMAGAGIINQELQPGQKVHYVVEKVEDVFRITVTPEGDKSYVAEFKYNDSGYVIFADKGKDTPVSLGLAVAGATATVTNMKYTDNKGEVVYDQNLCYAPIGNAPIASAITATVPSTRDYINVSWDIKEAADGDGVFVLEMKKGDGEWTVLKVLQETSYRVELTQSDYYQFRVSGKLGAYGELSTPVSTEREYIVAALAKPQVNISYTSKDITLTWDAIDTVNKYEIYRYSYDEGADNAKVVATVTEPKYTDSDVVSEVPYYYYVKGYSADNNTNPSDVVWAVPTAGHKGDYVYEDEATEITITKKSYDTVFKNKAVLEGVADKAGEIKLVVNGEVQSTKTVAVRGTFAFEASLKEGRNDVDLLFTDSKDNVTRKTFNFVYLTNYDIVVDASIANDGDLVNGKPAYKTVQAAVNAAGSSRTVIFVKAGSYKERLVVDKPNISIIGEDRENTLIHCYPGELGEDYEAGADMKLRCATYIMEGSKGFSAENIAFANDYVYSTPDNKSNKSADALRCDADEASFVNVKFSSVQDTLYMDKGKQYYNKCLIEGSIDFIYSGETATSLFDDCTIKFVYESTKPSGYVAAPKTKAAQEYGLIFNNCVITSEEGCSGTGYLLARNWGASASATWVNCFMGDVLYTKQPYAPMGGPLSEARFTEFGTYGPGFEINVNRNQISPAAAEKAVKNNDNVKEAAGKIGSVNYVGDVASDFEEKFDEQVYNPDTNSPSDGDDTNLKQYDMEGYAAGYGVTGGGLLKDTSDNYYKAGTATQFLDALLKIKETGKKSVIELTSDINLGCNEVENFDSYSSIIKAYKAQALTHPTLMKTGVSQLTLENYNNLTIISTNGSSIKHANITLKKSENIIIRNIKFDELWEWDEATEGNYDRNDWDYMTIDEACDGIWIDHCTFYKAYDGIIDVKNPVDVSRITISWCEFLPGSENNTFFNEMMNVIYENPSDYATYQHMIEGGMTRDQVHAYAYAQKKTHLFGQSDDATNAAGIRVTLANNYYKNSMDRMPRLRYGDSHVYNCIMDSQALLNVKNSINSDLAKKIVSNGASSTCGAHVLLENCFISGIENALNSGNGSSPSGYINAINSKYYMNGVETELVPKCNSTGDTRVLITDAEAFKAALPYTYKTYDADNLNKIVIPNAGAGKLDLTYLQWEKTSYNADYVDIEDGLSDADVLVKVEINEITDAVLTNEVKMLTGCETVEELKKYLSESLTGDFVKSILGKAVEPKNTKSFDVNILISTDNGKTWSKATESNFPIGGVDIVLPYPEEVDVNRSNFVVGHLFTTEINGAVPGTMEYLNPQKTEDGLKIHVTSASPFVIGWEQEAKMGDDSFKTIAVCSGLMIASLLGAAYVIMDSKRRKRV